MSMKVVTVLITSVAFQTVFFSGGIKASAESAATINSDLSRGGTEEANAPIIDIAQQSAQCPGSFSFWEERSQSVPAPAFPHATGISAPCLAAFPPSPPPFPPPFFLPPPVHPITPFGFEALFAGVDLTDNQRESLQKLRSDFLDDMDPLLAELRIKERAMHRLLTDETLNTTQVKLTQSEIDIIHSKLSDLAINHFVSISQILTPKQRKRLHQSSLRFETESLKSPRSDMHPSEHSR